MQKPDAHLAAPVVGGSVSEEALSLLRECLDAVEWAAREAGHLEGAALCRRIDKFLNTQPAPLGDGGSAFPIPGNEFVGHDTYWGMSLRDYFAAKIAPPDDLALYLAEKLASRKHPMGDEGKSGDPLEIVTFWADVEAAYRYIRADAMLRARAA